MSSRRRTALLGAAVSTAVLTLGTAAGQAQKDGYKKAFSACMEGKGYTVK